MIGAGGLGCPILLYLAAAGVGCIGIVDPDEITLSNMHRQVLYRIKDQGRSKAIVAKERIEEINPYATVMAYIKRVTEDNIISLISQFDTIIDGTDNLAAKYLISDACFIAQKTLVYGSIMPLEGQVTVFNALTSEGKRSANYRDLFNVQPNPSLVPNCAEVGVIGILPGIIGCFQANEVIKLITGLGQPLIERLLIYDSLGAVTSEVNYSLSADNPLRNVEQQALIVEGRYSELLRKLQCLL